MPRYTFILLFALLAAQHSAARGTERVSLAFYNVENLFDTLPSARYDDGRFTPHGANRWDTEKYRTKLRNIARVIDDLSPDIIGLAETEGETTVRDLVTTLRTDYNYIWLASGDSQGRDVALLYKGDKFIPDSVAQLRAPSSRKPLYVRGELYGQRIDLVICHLPSMLNGAGFRRAAMESLYGFAERLHRRDTASRIIIMGDFNATPSDRHLRRIFLDSREEMGGRRLLFSPLAEAAGRGLGSYVYDGRWLLYDNILLDTGFIAGGGLRYRDSGIFVREYMLQDSENARSGYPLRSFTSGRYTAGYSDHLPVFVIMDR